MAFHMSLSDSKSPEKSPRDYSRTLLRIQADLSNAVVWMISTCSLIYESSSLYTNPLRIVPSPPTKIGITVIFMFHRFFSFYPVTDINPSFHFFNVTQCSAGIPMSTIRQGSLSLLTIKKSGRLAEIWWSVCISKSQGSLCLSFSGKKKNRVAHVPLFCMVKFQFFAEFPVDHFSHSVLSSFIFFYYHLLLFKFFHTSFWLTAILLKYPGLASVFWPFLTKQ